MAGLMGGGAGPIQPVPKPDDTIDANAEAMARLRRGRNKNRVSVEDLIVSPTTAAPSDGVNIPGVTAQ